MGSTTKTIVLITGANQGIGAAAAIRLAKEHDYHVIVGSRSLAAGEKISNQLKSEGFSADAVQLDLQSDDSIAAATKYIADTYGHLDVLVNNAGVLLDMKGLGMRELFNTTFSTNVAGTGCLTHSLLPLLRKSEQRPRVLFVSSRMGSVAESLNTSTPFYSPDYHVYDASKAAVNILATNYSRFLADQKAYVNAVCPGLVCTNLTGYMEAGTTPEIGAQRIVEMATLTGKNSEVTGTFSDANGPIAW